MPIPAPSPGTYTENGARRVAQPTSHTPNSPPVAVPGAPKAKMPAITYVEFAAAVKDALRDVHSPTCSPATRCCATGFGISAGQPAHRS